MSWQNLRRGFTCALLILLVFNFPACVHAMVKNDPRFSPAHRTIPDQLIVKFRSQIPSAPNISAMSSSSEISSSSISILMNKYGVFKVEELMPKAQGKGMSALSSRDAAFNSSVCKLTLGNAFGADINAIAKEFGRDPAVEYAEPNRLFQICVSPNDPYYDRQWGLAKIHASSGWDARTGDPGIVIAVVDTGVDITHPDLFSNIWVNSDEIPGNGIDDDGNGYIDDVNGWDFVSVPPDWVASGEDPGPEDNDPSDFVGHGTHVSGIAAGRTNNKIGTAGITWDCKIMPLRAGYAASDGYGYLEYFDAGKAIIYAANNGASVINMSWGGLDDSDFIRNAISYAHSKGCVLIASSGNVISEYAGVPFYPAAYPEVIAVSSTDEDDMLSIWDWYVFSNFGSFVDVCAPGSYILSTVPGGGYAYYSGTSMASPMVAGLAALIKTRYPWMTNDEIMQRIKTTADNVDANNPGFLQGQMGGGRINVHRAMGGLVMAITYPSDGGEVGSGIMIKGSANSERFGSYKLEYGEGADPSAWTSIGNASTSPVENGVLGMWNAGGLSGDYTIKLTVSDLSSESFSASSKVIISSLSPVVLSGPPIPAPNPFDPSGSSQMKVRYEVTSVPPGGVNVDMCIYDISGDLIFRRSNFSAGAGVVDVTWDGTTAFGDTVANGVYPLVLASQGKIIGKSKIAVIR